MSSYIPKPDDIVFMGTGFTRYVVVDVDATRKTARVKNVTGTVQVLHTASWSNLHHLDESQNALRIVREATENK